MQLGLIGLGKMGGNMAARLAAAGVRVVGYDPDPAVRGRIAEQGVAVVDSLAALVGALDLPRAVWVMVPAGDPVDGVIRELAPTLGAGAVLVDGGNSYYRDAARRASELRPHGIELIDVGTSGGVWGRENGYCMMVGGSAAAVDHLRPALEALAPAPDRGWAHVGPSGAGHFAKMIHNGIEYGMMQAYAEGFALLAAKQDFDIDLAGLADVWSNGSVVRSWLLDLTARALAENPTLDGIAPFVQDSGEGRWTVLEAVEQGVSAPVIALSLMRRFESRDEFGFADRLLAAMRNQFGGHAIKKEA